MYQLARFHRLKMFTVLVIAFTKTVKILTQWNQATILGDVYFIETYSTKIVDKCTKIVEVFLR